MKIKTILFISLLFFCFAVLIGLPGCAGSAESMQGPGKGGGETGTDTAEVPEMSGELGKSETPEPTAEPADTPKSETSGGARGADLTDEEKFFEAEDFEAPEEPSTGGGEGTRTAREDSRPSRPSPPSQSGLKAGFADDNKQYGYFIGFLEEYSSTPHLPLDVSERIIITVQDDAGKSIPNADIEIRAAGRIIESGKTLADGRYLFFPSEYPSAVQEFSVEAVFQQQRAARNISRDGERNLTVSFDAPRFVPEPIPLDIVFIMDTTGSMGEEIDRLRTTIELIHLNLTNLSLKPAVRFGMVLYKDAGDEYRTRTIPLTENLEEFQAALDLVEASGGGDTPEDLQAALEDTIKKIDWDPRGVRLGFIITDAPPHIDYGQEFDYVDSSKAAKAEGIKIFSVGTGGLSISGEYVLRQISQYTAGKYIFLTYGERGESEGGSAGSVSHHTGSNFQTDKLEAIIIRFAKEELSNLTDEPIEDGDAYFIANKIDDEEREETLDTLFGMALEQLVDYSSMEVKPDTPTAVIPLIAQEASRKIDAEYFTERLLQQTIRHERFRMVERSDIQSIMEELKLQLSGLTDNSQAVKVGELMNAEMLITGTLYSRDSEYELFLKLLRVESGEILSLTKAKIDTGLGLGGE